MCTLQVDRDGAAGMYSVRTAAQFNGNPGLSALTLVPNWNLLVSQLQEEVPSNTSHSARVRKFRDTLIGQIPRVPHDRRSLASMDALTTIELIVSYVTWRMRLIPKKPRMIGLWRGGVTRTQFLAVKDRLTPLLNDVAAGNDLEPYLSEQVRSAGIDLDVTRRKARKRRDIDMVLTRQGLHHFHIGVRTKGNPKGRSGSLVFAEVLPDEFRIVALSDHRAFNNEDKSDERMRFFRTCLAYMSKDIPPGQGFMPSPVMASGHSVVVWAFARTCVDYIERLDPRLDDPTFIQELYSQQTTADGARAIAKSTKPSLMWHFEDVTFGVLEKETKVFFCFLPYFQR